MKRRLKKWAYEDNCAGVLKNLWSLSVNLDTISQIYQEIYKKRWKTMFIIAFTGNLTWMNFDLISNIEIDFYDILYRYIYIFNKK